MKLYSSQNISNANCLDETAILVDTILYLSLYYLVNDLLLSVHHYGCLFLQ